MKKQLIFVKPNTITPESIAAMESEGYLVIEHPNPSEVRIGLPSAMTSDMIFNAAMKAIDDSSNTYVRESFFKNMYKAIYKEETQP